MTTLPHYDAATINQRLDAAGAMRAIRNALRSDLDPAEQPARARYEVTSGELLLMPSEALGYVGTKVTGVAPGNPARGLDRIQAVYVLLDAATFTPVATFDGGALTQLRTAAVSAAAVDALARRDAERLVVFGSGPQARSHIAAMQAIRPIRHVVIAARDAAKSEGLAAWVVEHGMQARISQAMSVTSALPEADLVVTATSAGDPLFDGALVRPGTVVVAVGSHDAQLRELEAGLLGRSTVVVEDISTALTTAGDVALAVEDGSITEDDLVPLRAIVRGEARPRTGSPIVFKSVGMGWEDLVVAAAVHAAPKVPSGTRRLESNRIGGIGGRAGRVSRFSGVATSLR